MKTLRARMPASLLALLALVTVTPAGAQVPVDDSGAPLAEYESFEPDATTGNEDIPLLTHSELQELVGPIALYPDDLLAIVLPASTYPLQLVQAQRFLEDLEEDPSLKPDESWDDSVIALLNYPEVVELLNEDLDWTWRLGEAVVAQQADVVEAVASFRDRAYAAGNLKSDTRQTVARSDGAIEITPVEDDVIYVPYYEPERVVVYQARPVYHYYPRAYPVYYYPYPVGYAFDSGFFWGVTTAFTVGWVTDSLYVFHHSYYGHPYYGHHYWDGWWYRRPPVHVHNHYYSIDRHTVSSYRYSHGDHWRPRYETRRRLHDQRIARSDYYTGRSVQHRSYATTRPRETEQRRSVGSNAERRQSVSNSAERRQSVGNNSERRRSVGSNAGQRQSFGTDAVDNRRQQRRAAVPAATRQATRRETQPQRFVEERQARYTPPRAARAERSADSRRQADVQRQPSRPETTARREHRASDYRQEQRRVTAPKRDEQRARPRQATEESQARHAERSRHASSRGDGERRQRH